MPDLLLTFYGDDFTGSADVMEALALNGVRSVLFLAPPSRELLQSRFPNVEAVGVAGSSRAMTPVQMEAALPPVFTALQQLNARLFHYKICSTFDSSPQIGSIGKAYEIGQCLFASSFVPMIVGAPVLKRYCVFGNLFATIGAETFRLDRHAMMARHPVTPMTESDLRLHLAQQTRATTALLDVLQLNGDADEHLARLLQTRPDIVLFDTLDQTHLAVAGRLLWQSDARFVIGSSGVEYALTAHWQRPQVDYSSVGAVEQIIVMSGSCSAATQGQIEWARAHGFAAIALDAEALMRDDEVEHARSEAKQAARAVLSQGQSVLLYSAQGSDDPRIAAALAAMNARGLDEQTARARLGREQGLLLRELLLETGLRRVCIAGGDTSSHVVQQLGIYALELRTPMAPGSPLCRAYAHDVALDGLEIAMKGGQHGRPDYFDCIRRGTYEAP